MSDPVTNVEIEDVLSSIRKLVSADDRHAKGAVQSEAAEPGKLVLTPALRVDHDAAQADADADRSDTADVDETPKDEAAGADVFAAADAAEPDLASAATEDPVAEDRSADELQQEEPRTVTDAGSGSESGRAAIFQRAAGTRDDEWEPDESVDDAARPAAGVLSDSIAAPGNTDSDEALPWQDDTPEIQSAAALSAAEEMEGLDAFTPDADMPEEEERSVHPQDEAAGSIPEQENAFLSDRDMFDEDDAILDEEALRDLVAEIVRQELQGSLGERITRNVRKLVRREIQRALAAQELD